MNNNIVKENRKEDLDILRVIAIIFVLSVHGLSYIGFYEHRFSGGVMFILSVVRTLFITCVPLFLIITGALHNEDNYNKKFFVRLIKIIIIYTIAAILCSIFNIVKDKITVKTILINYFSFKAAPYGWYVGMYMGLYLMIPFLNTCLFLIVIIPSVFNTFNFDNVNWLYGTQESYTKVVDEYWTFLYPVFYFFIGKYIYEFSKNNNRYNKKKVILLLILACTLFGFINYFKNYDYFYPFTKETSYSGYQSVVISCLITMLVLNTKNKWIKMFLEIWTISCAILLLMLIYTGGRINNKLIIKSLLPNFFTNNWYVTAYLIFYPLHTVLNRIIKDLNQKNLLKITTVLFLLYCVCNSLYDSFFSSVIIMWITLYFFIAYIKIYMIELCNNIKVNRIVLIIGISIIVFLIVFTYIVGGG